eukprot:CAMPEP_0170571944 /NCGR_PEP_ID=MMETSP0224-20130122/1951_1 /TAXON_ID=285029 /ORGANISM="Togula jolla, Strain CCCM 725" /LENGTH=148 /DNA_ID=CAMNT_0010894397 /DNA_START=254 /DNA_END=696 /DNA_ORIENTATION=+
MCYVTCPSVKLHATTDAGFEVLALSGDCLWNQLAPRQCVSELLIETVFEPKNIVVVGRPLALQVALLRSRSPMNVHICWILFGNKSHELGKTHVRSPMDADFTCLDFVHVDTAQPVPGIPDEGEGEGLAEVLRVALPDHLVGAPHLWP